ncbi:uncharacterized protein MELLADRAFT_63869 [Melampsora larici-populina 98AG31]|uniref:Uncharacterized protein n=1 Tax=Melampsora larici-populina (strain 98AG31 / pathotype 3-4-7) TaxID=747676 RepID=F4RNT7_MELLP|nr:uncharacterized protein MELLADRAFT_63869 [Melampsora larici-populina 98AG31]EGG05854.1 hypothetical protein MELLADRAFT_63869 [Melampsora larici-populina 98AG31]
MTIPIRRRWWENPTASELAWFRGLSYRSKSEIIPYPITERSHPDILAGLDQCFDCGELGHSRITTGCISTNPDRKAPDFNDWRRSTNGKTYTVDKLRMSKEDLARLAAEALEEVIEAPMTLSSDDVDILDSIEAAASSQAVASQAVTDATEHSDDIDELGSIEVEASSIATTASQAATSVTEHEFNGGRDGSTSSHDGPQDGQDYTQSLTVDDPSAEGTQNEWAPGVRDASREYLVMTLITSHHSNNWYWWARRDTRTNPTTWFRPEGNKTGAIDISEIS